jgi:hypothetical protein
MDAFEGLCRTCGWFAPYIVRHKSNAKQVASFSERYRGTIYDSRPSVVTVVEGGLSRGRMIVGMGFVAVLALFGMIVFWQSPV